MNKINNYFAQYTEEIRKSTKQVGSRPHVENYKRDDLLSLKIKQENYQEETIRLNDVLI